MLTRRIGDGRGEPPAEETETQRISENGGRSPSPARTRTGAGRDAVAHPTAPTHHDRPWTLPCSPAAAVTAAAPAAGRARHAKTVVVVPIAGAVPVARARTQVLRVVVPGTPRNTRRPGAGQAPGTGRPRGANHPSRKIARRRRHVSACAACATQARTRCSTSRRVTVPARQRSRSPRNRLRKRRTPSSGSLLRPPGRNCRRHHRGRHVRLGRVQRQPTPRQKRLRAGAPVGKPRRVVSNSAKSST